MRTRGFEVVSRLEDENIKLPERSTRLSAGYDFFAYEDVIIPSVWNCLEHIKPVLVKTGVKCYMQEDEVLELFNRSSNPKKFGLIIPNSVGIIDADYYNNEDNEGEICFLFYNIFPSAIKIEKGQKIGQGIFKKFLKADGDNAVAERIGGFGSSGR